MEYNVELMKTFMTSVMTGAGRATGYLLVLYLFLRKSGRFLRQFIEAVMENESNEESEDEGFYDFRRTEE